MLGHTYDVQPVPPDPEHTRYLDAGATSPGVSPVPGSDFDATLRAAAALI